MAAAGNVLAFEPDLMFSSRIESPIGKMGVQVKVVKDYDLLLQELTTEIPKLLILDLDALEGKLPALCDLLSESCVSVGYYSHTNTGLAERAKRAGDGYCHFSRCVCEQDPRDRGEGNARPVKGCLRR